MRAGWITILVLAACAGNNLVDTDPFATLQGCFDDNHGAQSLSVNDSIVVCCIDHPIGLAMTQSCRDNADECVCGDNADACVAYVMAELDATTSGDDIACACDDYAQRRTKPDSPPDPCVVTKKGM